MNARSVDTAVPAGLSVYGVQGRRLLLIEDNPGDADFILDLLDDSDDAPEVTHTGSLGDGLQMLGADDFDAVLLDLNLPDSRGVEGVRAVRARTDRLPIVVLTGIDDRHVAVDCILAGAQDYLAKSELAAQGLLRAIGYAIARASEARHRQRAESLNETMASIVAASSDAIYSVDRQGLLTSWNAGAERTFGYRAEEALGKPLDAIVPATDGKSQAERQALLDKVFEGEGVTSYLEVRRLRRDGRALTLSVTVCPLRGSEGDISGVAGICRDITEAEQRGQALLRRTEQLESRDRNMRALNARLNAVREEERTRIARQVHDVLGPLLTGLNVDLRWIERHVGRAEEVALRARLAEAHQLVEQTVATVQRIAIDMRPSALDALGLSAALRDEVRRFEARTGVRTAVGIRTAGKPPAPVATALFRITQELMWNAARHAQASELSIELAHEDGALILRVLDNGIGIDPGVLEQPTSLGLMGMRERAEAIGGTFNIRPRVDGGTEAVVRVPR